MDVITRVNRVDIRYKEDNIDSVDLFLANSWHEEDGTPAGNIVGSIATIGKPDAPAVAETLRSWEGEMVRIRGEQIASKLIAVNRLQLVEEVTIAESGNIQSYRPQAVLIDG